MYNLHNKKLIYAHTGSCSKRIGCKMYSVVIYLCMHAHIHKLDDCKLHVNFITLMILHNIQSQCVVKHREKN